MNEILQPYLVELLELVKTTGSFIVGELPAISKEIIMWGIIKAAISPLIFISITVMLAFTSVKIKNSKENISEADNFYKAYEPTCTHFFFYVAASFAIIFGIATVCVLFDSVSAILKAIFAPRLFLIEQIKLML